jgi:tRNA/rRNA methyltransferase
MDNTVTIILSKPQMGENIGSIARVMSNFGCVSLKIIRPRDGWPNIKADELAASGKFILDNAEIYDDINDAISELHLLYGTAATKRFMVKPVLKPHDIVSDIRKYDDSRSLSKLKVGFLFGCERSGLTNDELAICDAIVNIPTSKLNHSLNIAQAVAIICYEFFMKRDVHSMKTEKEVFACTACPVDKSYIKNLFDYIESELTKKNHFKSPNMKPVMMRNIKNSLIRARFTEQEINTLFGILKTLSGK